MKKAIVFTIMLYIALFVTHVPILADELATSSATLASEPIRIVEASALTESGGSLLQIYAAGMPYRNVYPTMEIMLNDIVVATFTDIRGDVFNRVFQEYQFVSMAPMDIHSLKFRFANDAVSNLEDRNLRIDRVVLDGVEYQTESPTTYHLSEYYCISGFIESEWLYCPESVMFDYQPNSTPTVTPTPITICQSRSIGDADCNNTVTLVDFEIWRKEYDGTLQTSDADFNADATTSIIDFEIWRRSYLT